MPKISVIVPVYKVEEYLRRCVDSILNQTFQDFELILVDDGSPDNCPKICDEYAQKDNRVFVIHKENGGLSDARNKGIDWAFENSDSEWITFIDSDDWVHQEYLQTLHDIALKYKVDISACEMYFIPENWALYNEDIVDLLTPELFWIRAQTFAVAVCKLYKKKLWQESRFPKGKIFEDEPTIYPMIFAGGDIAYSHKALYYYYKNEQGISHCKWTPRRLYILEVLQEELKFLKRQGFKDAYDTVKSRTAKWYIKTLEEATLANDDKIYNDEIKKTKRQFGRFLRKNFPVRNYADMYIKVFPKKEKIIRFFEKLDSNLFEIFKRG